MCSSCIQQRNIKDAVRKAAAAASEPHKTDQQLQAAHSFCYLRPSVSPGSVGWRASQHAPRHSRTLVTTNQHTRHFNLLRGTTFTVSSHMFVEVHCKQTKTKHKQNTLNPAELQAETLWDVDKKHFFMWKIS